MRWGLTTIAGGTTAEPSPKRPKREAPTLRRMRAAQTRSRRDTRGSLCGPLAVCAMAPAGALGSSAMANATIDPGIFKAYDVRGLYPDQINADVAEPLGRGFVRVLSGMAGKAPGELRIGLGRDMRPAAPELAARYRDGMVAEGAHVVDAGMVGTEMLYWLVGARGLDGGVMCTASHNPKAYTGAKFVKDGAIALSGDEGLQEIREAIEAGLGDPPGGGSVEEVD